MDDAFKKDLKAAQAIRLPWWVLLCLFAGAIIVGELFNRWGRLELALPVLNTVLVIGFVAAVKWDMRAHVWYWITLTIIVAVHVPLIMFIPWTTKWVPAFAIAMIDSVDLCAMLVVFSLIRRCMAQRATDER
jgi:hypothetical protein